MKVKHCNDARPCFPDGMCHYPLNCKKASPPTWGDAIRSMTDEELAAFLVERIERDRLLEWLKSVKEEADGN